MVPAMKQGDVLGGDRITEDSMMGRFCIEIHSSVSIDSSHDGMLYHGPSAKLRDDAPVASCQRVPTDLCI